jgi:adenosylmethionine-8-amino-7-oxononanoate aminotransferase
METGPIDPKKLLELDKRHLLHPVSEFRKHEQRGPKVFMEGRGVELRLADGTVVLDGFSGLFNINAGHGREEIARSVWEQMKRLAYYPSFWDFSNEPAIRLAKRICELLPPESRLSHVLFTTSGSESNEVNFRIARLYHHLRGKPTKVRILSRRHAYHGATRAALSATGITAYHLMTDLDPSHIRVTAPYCYRCEFDLDPAGCSLECVQEVERTIARQGPDTIAAFIAEPVMGTGGIIVPPDDYFKALCPVLRRHDILLILDEVITGFGRTGKWFAMEHWGVSPDLLSLAKGISSGYLPLGAAVLSDHVYETMRDLMPQGLPFMFGFTYNNHPACCAAGLANIEILQREDLPARAAKVGDYLLNQLRERFGHSPIVGDIRGLGMLAAMEIVQDRPKKAPFKKPGAPMVITRAAFQKGLILRPLFENVAWAPPLCATEEEIDRMVDILAQVWPEAERKLLEGAQKT